ncbi:MAG: NAD(+) synthase [Methylococcaceae bacterium]|nr:NAD(+) synthase [Methylococcaceae bacterium]MDD1607843.1 NAD(+) synthase [Methylococcaceae bacterium]MDD1609160.1 NAD(+) synthase [Methylococcaceae bacterium]MDD1615084.1 NAD(+) synthase [Methylococcaceae bacterium]OYV21192.1 MAG: NAD+ synthase [Methylococcaceae bacterium NSP1-2]
MSINLTAALKIDESAEIAKIAERLREILRSHLHRRGLIVAISGGIDSAVCAALAVQAVGAERVFGLLMPERDSVSDSTLRGRMMVKQFGLAHEEFNIAPVLDALGCYRWRDDAIRAVFPAYGADWKNKIIIAGGQTGHFNYFKLVVQSPDGQIFEERLDSKNYLQIVAATNFKQRVRKTLEYFHADRLNYAVVGTPNRVEYDQGFFVKNGDGSADVKPIAHLYKTQVYALARYLKLPEEICNAQPTTDTYSMAQGQDEFYYALPYDKMDVALLAYNRGEPPAVLAKELAIGVDQAEFIYRDIEAKRKTTAMLHWSGIPIETVIGPNNKPPILD